MQTRMAQIVARSIAIVLGAFSLCNVLLDWISPGFDANIWWIDLRWLPGWLAHPLLLTAASALLLHASLPARAKIRRLANRAALASALVLGAIAFANGVWFYVLLARGAVTTGFPLPLSLLLAAGLGCVARDAASRSGLVNSNAVAGDPVRNDAAAQPGRPAAESRRRRLLSWPGAQWQRVRRSPRLQAALLAGAWAFCFPILQMFAFGKTDYTRPADAIVVFGARVYPDGRMSLALYDRVRTGVDLYLAGHAALLVFSGGPGDEGSGTHEADAMRDYALERGVPEDAIVLDREGLSTEETVSNTVEYLRERGIESTLAVSHFYHLPRIKLSYQRAGFAAYTVPAKETRTLTQLPYYMLREAAAWLYYYALPFLPLRR